MSDKMKLQLSSSKGNSPTTIYSSFFHPLCLCNMSSSANHHFHFMLCSPPIYIISFTAHQPMYTQCNLFLLAFVSMSNVSFTYNWISKAFEMVYKHTAETSGSPCTVIKFATPHTNDSTTYIYAAFQSGRIIQLSLCGHNVKIIGEMILESQVIK
mmetsp:Transcript_35100/g.81176  ORF Transcript_35100/g.81176 Transcript_35100/m.81176 type:complete len:155 (+) Transcript_35100:29-493(+)